MHIRTNACLVVMLALYACSAPHTVGNSIPDGVAADEVLEDPLEEHAETPQAEQAEEAQEAQSAGTSGGAPAAMQTAGAGTAADAVSAAAGVGASSGGANGAAGTGAAGDRGSTHPSAGAGVAAAGIGSAPIGGAGAAVVSDAGAAAAMGGAGAGGSGAFADPGSVQYPALDITQIAKPVQINTGTTFGLAEGPLWDPCNHQLLFVDVTASTLYTLSSTDTIGVLATNTNNTNGIAFDVDGSLILAQMAPPGHIARRDKTGKITPIDPPGPPLHTPDDVTVRSDGTIYFTDGDFPPIGTINLGPLPVYAITPGATKLRSGGSVPGPNGIELSPDEKTLYVDAYVAGQVVMFAVAPDGTLTKGATLLSGLTNPDSLCLDAAGNLYVGVSSGLQIVRPDGTRVGLIPVPTLQGVTNCAFGGADGKTLYITAWTSLWKITNMPIQGLDWQVNRRRLGCP